MAQVLFTGFGFSAPGALTPVELRMKQAFPLPALEEFRQRVLQAVTESTNIDIQVRAASILAISTDVRAVFTNLVGTSRALLTAKSDERRRLLAVDVDLRVLKVLEEQVLEELASLRVPPAYLDLLRVRLSDATYQSRVSAACAVVLLASFLLRGTV